MSEGSEGHGRRTGAVLVGSIVLRFLAIPLVGLGVMVLARTLLDAEYPASPSFCDKGMRGLTTTFFAYLAIALGASLWLTRRSSWAARAVTTLWNVCAAGLLMSVVHGDAFLDQSCST
jgi:hypothetical protein